MSALPSVPVSTAAAPVPPTPFKELWRDFRRNRGAMIGLAVIVGLVLCALLADLIARNANRALFYDLRESHQTLQQI
jgi:dipeptide transport system permease protein